MKNFLQEGDKFDYVAGGTVNPGDVIVVGALIGVAENGGGNGDHITVAREGVFELAKAAGVWNQGDRLFWDSVALNFTTDDTKTPVKAVAFAAALNGDTTGYVLLDEAGGFKIAAGQHASAAAVDTVATGLSKVLAVMASFDDDVADGNMYVTASIGDQNGAPVAGSVYLKSWKTDGADPTPAAATGFGKKINWIAIGIG